MEKKWYFYLEKKTITFYKKNHGKEVIFLSNIKFGKATNALCVTKSWRESGGQNKTNKQKNPVRKRKWDATKGEEFATRNNKTIIKIKSQGTRYESVHEVSCSDRQGKQSSIPEVKYLNVPFLILFSEVFECPFSNTLF